VVPIRDTTAAAARKTAILCSLFLLLLVDAVAEATAD